MEFIYKNNSFFTEEALDLILQHIEENNEFEALLKLPLTLEQDALRKFYLRIWSECEEILEKNLVLTIRKYLSG